METEDAVYDILEDIPPPLEHTAELLKSIIQTASSSPRNTQKILHLVSRGVEILQALRTPFSEPGPSDFYEMIVAMESVRKLELILMEARSLIEQEATLPTSYTEESKATWGVRRDKLHDLLVEAHAPEFNPPNDWEKALEDVARVDDHLWVGMIAHDIWNGGSNLELAKEVERTAAKLLELKDNSRKQDIERIMMGWEPSRTDAHSPPRSLRDFPMPLRSLGSGSRNSRSNSPVPSRQDSPAPGAISLESSHMNKIFQSLSDYYIPKHRLRIREQTLGGGGFGRVKLADLSTETGFPAGNTLTTVAVKILHTENFDGVPLGIAVRLAREIELWASCKHANILELTGYYNSEDFREVYMISPYMANGNIKDYLSREAPSQEHRLKLVLGTIKGLAYLHTREPPIVHGDLKSRSVLVTNAGEALLCDLDLARAVEDETTGLSTSNGFKGPIRYTSLELLDGNLPDCPSDMWAWGCLVLEIMTGNPPYHELRTDIQVLLLICAPEDQRRTPEPSDTSSLPSATLDLMRMCWSFEPGQRPDALQCVDKVEAMSLVMDSPSTNPTPLAPTPGASSAAVVESSITPTPTISNPENPPVTDSTEPKQKQPVSFARRVIKRFWE